MANRLIVACIDTIDHPSIELVAIVLVPPLLCCDQVVLKAISLHHFWHPFSTNGEANNGEVHPFWIQFILSPSLLLPLTTMYPTTDPVSILLMLLVNRDHVIKKGN